VSAAVEQAGQLVRLRAMRLTRAERALAAARAEAARAEGEARAAQEQAAAAEARLADDRLELATYLNAAAPRLALVERAAFLQSVAKSAANDAVEQRRLCDEAERARRKALIAARARHDRMTDHVRTLHARAALRHEEAAAIEVEDARRRR